MANETRAICMSASGISQNEKEAQHEGTYYSWPLIGSPIWGVKEKEIVTK